MACQVWDKDGNIHHVEIDEMERGLASGLYRLTEEVEEKQPEQPKRGRKPKAVENED